MATLFTYMQNVQRFMRDTNQRVFQPESLISYINRARVEVCTRSHCLRFVPRISAGISSFHIVSGGSGYSAGTTLTVSPPDSPGGLVDNPGGAQATGTVTISGGAINNAYVTNGGDGYFQPVVTLNDPAGTGTGASILPVLPQLMTTVPEQEVYPFSNVNMDFFPGIQGVFAVRSVSIIYANTRYSVSVRSFSEYQARFRNFGPGMFLYTPTIGAQLGRGAAGSFYLYPVPSQVYQMEWDCSGLPQELLTNQDVEAIPEPYTHCVPYYAAHLAYMEIQNLNYARMYEDMFDKKMLDYGAATLPGRVITFYGRQ